MNLSFPSHIHILTSLIQCPFLKTLSQFKLLFDQTRLTFDEVNFNTGNNTTNFAYAGDKLINFGSINQQKAAIKKDSKYILTFTKGASVDSPAGLFSIRNFDAANLKGELIILDFE